MLCFNDRTHSMSIHSVCRLFVQQHNVCDNGFLFPCHMGKSLSSISLLIILKAVKAENKPPSIYLTFQLAEHGRIFTFLHVYFRTYKDLVSEYKLKKHKRQAELLYFDHLFMKTKTDCHSCNVWIHTTLTTSHYYLFTLIPAGYMKFIVIPLCSFLILHPSVFSSTKAVPPFSPNWMQIG